MSVLAKDRSYDRARLLKRAAAARKKRKPKKAIALYRQVLRAEPENNEIHQKIAPLLAQTRQGSEALTSYQKAAQGLLDRGFEEQAVGLYRAAAASLPSAVSLWRSLAELQLRRGRKADAVETLVEGRRHFRGKRQRRAAIQLLILARKIEPTNFKVSYDLACQLGKSGRVAEALRLLEELAARANRRNLRSVRARQLWLAPSAGGALRYLRALLLGR